MKQILFALCFVALLSAITVEMEEGAFGTIEYTIEDRNAYNSTLTIVVMQGEAQHSVYSIEGCNGLYDGKFQILEPATYTIKVYNLDTGEAGEATLSISPEKTAAQAASAVEEVKEEATAQQVIIDIPQEQESWLIYLIVGVFIVLIVVILFANPLKGKKKKK